MDDHCRIRQGCGSEEDPGEANIEEDPRLLEQARAESLSNADQSADLNP